MSPILFWFFAVLMLFFGGLVVLNRNPVAGALSLVVSFLCLAVLFVGLDAYFIAVIQVLVYAGAVMVLFLFIIMLLDLRVETRRKINVAAYLAAIAIAIGFVAELAFVLDRFALGRTGFPALAAGTHDDVRQVGITLFTTHNLPLQVIGVLLLVATIGVVVLSRRELK